jgi:hypothetical protein
MPPDFILGQDKEIVAASDDPHIYVEHLIGHRNAGMGAHLAQQVDFGGIRGKYCVHFSVE